ncbi:MAG TPA: histidine kinase [Anaerolineales bacterium]
MWVFIPEFINTVIAGFRHGIFSNLWIGWGLPMLAGMLSLFLALLIFWHRSDDGMGLFTSFFLLVYGIVHSGMLEALSPIFPNISRYTEITLPGVVVVLTLILFANFPDGRLVPRWTRWVVRGAFLTILLYLIRSLLYPPFIVEFSEPGDLSFTVLIFVLVVIGWISIFYAQVYRYRYVSTPQQRQQTKWAVYGMSASFGLQMFLAIPWLFTEVLPYGFPFPSWQDLSSVLYSLRIYIPILPVTLTIAVMRYRLYDIDIIINRTLVYGALTAIVVAIYILMVGVVGSLLHTQGNLLITLLATGLIAVLFQPLRERLQRGVNRLIYGDRDDPIEVLSRLGKQMEVALPSDQVLPSLVKTIAQTLKLPYVGITQKGRSDISFGRETENPVSFPFIFQGETTGVLLASPRSPSESFSSAEARLLQNLARQAGVVVRNAQLAADLQRSRQTLVTAREEERHRLRRDLHDGIGPTMAGLTLKLDVARDLVSSNLESGKKEDLEEAMQLLNELKSQTQETVQNIRHIVHTLRPPSLDVLGLVPALQAHFGQVAAPRSLNIQMTTAPQSFPRLSAAVEVAAYRIILEAVTNVINHAQAEICKVSLSFENGSLIMEIKDDGMGLPKVRKQGIGLDSMRERAEELGGRLELSSSSYGTQVCAEIPIAQTRNDS